MSSEVAKLLLESVLCKAKRETRRRPRPSKAAKVVLESVLHKEKREDIWATKKKANVIEEKKSTENRKAIFARAKQERYDRHENICHGGVIEIGTRRSADGPRLARCCSMSTRTYGAREHEVLPAREWGKLDLRARPQRFVDHLDRPHPEFHGAQISDQPGGELQWIITADLRGKMEPPTSERILFSFMESNDGLARALQEGLARLCGMSGEALKHPRFSHLARRNSAGEPMDMQPHPELKHHVDHLDFMLYHTQQDLDNARSYANQTHLALTEHADAIKLLAKDRKTLRRQKAKKDATIARLRAKIASLEATVKARRPAE
ncbi:hypothetical protein QYE76_061103 [Lolium multiflorum]|uniref:Uncharacterized protein n=1 Tax=Lolium multiflorum TaxID=4521 RepID=A0AAD8S1M6_LOLMU|nr:hypothetical protein QYE76_061103 [Lolium multiflorum]